MKMNFLLLYILILFSGFLCSVNSVKMLKSSKIQMKKLFEPKLSNYETPILHKQPDMLKVPKSSMISPDLTATSAADLKIVTSKLRLAKSNWEKKKACKTQIHYNLNLVKAAKIRLQAEGKQITDRIAYEVKQLIFAKSNADSLNKLLKKFEIKIQQDQLAKFKLVDRVQIKNDLKAKLEKDIQGLRTRGDQYDSVKKVDPKDLKKIIDQIKKKLGI